MTDPVLASLFEEFYREQKYSLQASDTTLRGYRNVFSLFGKIMPDTRLDQLDTIIMVEFFKRLSTRQRVVGHGSKVGIKKSTISTYRSKLNKFFCWLKVHGKIIDNPFDKMDYPNVRYENIQWLRQDQVKKIFAAVVMGVDWRSNYDRARNIAIIATLLFTGIRAGELAGIEITDVDLERRELTLRAAVAEKSDIQRIIPIHPKLKAYLNDYFLQRRARGYSTPSLFASSSADVGFTINGLKNVTERLVQASGVRFHPHMFRHTFAVNFLYQGGDIAKLKQLLGHRDIRMTAYYLRCLPTPMMRSNIDAMALDSLA